MLPAKIPSHVYNKWLVSCIFSLTSKPLSDILFMHKQLREIGPKGLHISLFHSGELSIFIDFYNFPLPASALSSFSVNSPRSGLFETLIVHAPWWICGGGKKLKWLSLITCSSYFFFSNNFCCRCPFVLPRSLWNESRKKTSTNSDSTLFVLLRLRLGRGLSKIWECFLTQRPSAIQLCYQFRPVHSQRIPLQSSYASFNSALFILSSEPEQKE